MSGRRLSPPDRRARRQGTARAEVRRFRRASTRVLSRVACGAGLPVRRSARRLPAAPPRVARPSAGALPARSGRGRAPAPARGRDRGRRACSSYGAQVARLLGRELASAGLVVLSGLARGMDAEAHRGALEAGGLTVAILGCGVDRDYPAAHAQLARRDRASGASSLRSTRRAWSRPRGGSRRGTGSSPGLLLRQSSSRLASEAAL